MSSEKVTEEMEITAVETPGAGGHLWRVGQKGYNHDVVRIEVVAQQGPQGPYPWYRVSFKDGTATEINSLMVEYVTWQPEVSDA